MKLKMLFLSLLLISSVFVLVLSQTKNKQITISQAQDPNPEGSPAWCADHCNPSPATNQCNQSETYAFPDCCRDIAASGDPFACSWPDRGYCLDSQCASIQGVSPQRCGGPKHSWCNLCTTNKCPGFVAATPTLPQPTLPPAPPTQAPLPTTPIIPTQPPQPTFYNWPSPTPQIIPPTSIPQQPTPMATNYIPAPSVYYPTYTPYMYPTMTPVYSPPTNIIDSIISSLFIWYRSKPSLSPKNILPQPSTSPKPTFSPETAIVNLNREGGKTLDIFEFIFWRVVFYDELLEKNINQKYVNFLKFLPKTEKK